MVFLLIFLVVLFVPQVAFADDNVNLSPSVLLSSPSIPTDPPTEPTVSTIPTTPATTPEYQIDLYNAEIMHWYHLLLQSFIFPLMVLSFATSGLKLLFSPIMSSPQAMDKLKSQIALTVAALIVAIMLPMIIGWAVSFFQSTGWQPPRLAQIIPWNGGKILW